jgi:hypothetical protein
MAKCTHCGAELPSDAAFCPHCATRVGGPPMPPAPPSPELASLSGLETVVATDTDTSPEPALMGEGEEFHGRYRVQRKIGSGAMGVVYLAEDRVTNRPVALKLINPALVKSPTAVQRFLREGLTARDVRHPNVIAVYDVGDDKSQLYLVMEYLEGENLRGWIHRAIQSGEDVPFETALDIVTEILRGLQAAHEAKVVHRDLKPENIMLLGDPLQDEFRLKILDFGIARAIDSRATTQLTSTGVATGTPLYMAPEQRTAVDLVIDRGLSSRPRSRYQSAREYLDALNAMGAAPAPLPPDQAYRPPRPPPPAPGPKPDRKRLWYGIAAGSLMLIVIAGIEEEFGSDPVVWPDPPVVPTQAVTLSTPPQNPPRSEVFTGTWYDQVLGINFVHAYVELHQSGNRVDGDIFNMQGTPVGTLSGNTSGTALNYRYDALGQTGSGIGVLRADGIHMDVRVTESSTGYSEQHVLHKNHMPN